MAQRQDRSDAERSVRDARTAGDGALDHCRYRAFISYSHDDQAWADWLIRALETYRVPSRLVGTVTGAGTIPSRLTPIFRDRDELASASHLGDKIREALADSACLIVICSPAAANSHWVNEEILHFRKLGRGHRILCLIVDGKPHASRMPGHEYKECFAPALREDDDASEAGHAEPIAPDVRDEMGGKSAARLKVIAGLLDVGFDVLKRRDQQRRMRRTVGLSMLALSIIAVTSTLAVTAFIAQRNAEAAREAAVRRQKQAEGLVNFMLGDLFDKLREVNRLDILKSVDDRAMAYFASLPVSDVTEQSLALRAKALMQIGSVRMNLGQYKRALDAFRLAETINRQRLLAYANHVEELTDHGESLTWVGFANWYMGHLAIAETNFQAAEQALSRALKVQPGNADTQLQLAYAYNNLAQVLAQQNKPEMALTNYRRQVGLIRHLLARDPGNLTYVTGLAQTAINVSGLEFQQGQLWQSVRDIIDPQRLLVPQVLHDPKNHELQDTLMISDAKLADVLHATGRQTLALAYIQRAVDIGTKLTRFDPKHADWKLLHCLYSIWQARWKLEVDPTDSAALAALNDQAVLLKRMLHANPKSAQIRRTLAVSQLSLASQSMASGHAGLARGYATSVLDTLGTLPKPSLSQIRTLRTACAAELILARLVDPPDHGKHAQRAHSLIAPVASHSSNPRTLTLWADVLFATGQRKQALATVRALKAMGYRTPRLLALLEREHIAYTPDSAMQSRLNAIIATIDSPTAALAKPARDSNTVSP